jgi:O-6-methylguanine DNA methyltransferase
MTRTDPLLAGGECMPHKYHRVVRVNGIEVVLDGEKVDTRFVLTRVRVGWARGKSKGRADTHPAMEKYGARIEKFLRGQQRDLSDMALSLDGFSAFRKKVTRAARRIPWGRTVSYAKLASMAGFSKAVRATASVMRNNPYPLVVPCHRVIRSDGSPGGFMGKTSGEHVALKRALQLREAARGKFPANSCRLK